MNQPLRVLIVEDQEDDALLILRALREGGYAPSSLRVNSAQALAVALETQPWDVVLSDYTLLQYDGAQTLALVHTHKPNLPVIFVTGTTGEEAAVRLVKAGAYDYVVKDRLTRLPMAVEQALRKAAERHMHEETQRALHDTAMQLSGVLEAATDGIFEIDTSGTIMLANGAAHRMFGWPPGALLNQPLTTIIPPEHQEQHAAGFRRLIQPSAGAAIGQVMEITGLRFDGTRPCCELSWSSLTHHNGEQRFVAILRDVTERKRTEKAIRSVNEQLTALVRSSPVAITILGVDGLVELWSPAAERLFGWTEAEVLGCPLPTVSPDTRDEHEAIRRQVLAGQTIINQELRRQCKNGESVLLSLSVTPLRDPLGAVTGMLGMMADITERKLLEVQAQRMDRLATLGQLLSGIAHELKNPLFIVAGRLQLLKEKLQGRRVPEIESDVALIAEAAERMTKIVERFLLLAKPVTPTQTLVSMEQVVQQTLDFLANELMKYQITVVRDFAPGLPQIRTDPHQIQGVLLNLILNAIQAMREAHGRGTLTVTTALMPSGLASDSGEFDGSGLWVEVRVRDDGPGILPEHRAKIFEPFFTTKAPGKGTGLGLWIVRSTVITLHGSVHCDSEAGQGATFTVRLPVGSPEPAAADPSQPAL